MANEKAVRVVQGGRLAGARAAAGWRSARAAALECGWRESSYRAHEAGTRTIGQDDAERYARRFRAEGVNVSAQSILFGSGRSAAPVPAADVTLVPLLSWVSAGELTDVNSQIPVSDVPLLAFADLGRGDFFALKVAGDSMDRISPDGSIIIVNRSDRQLVSGKPYVFFSAREGSTYKIWRAEPAYLSPYSTNPANQPIFIKRKRDFSIIGRVRRTVLDL